MNDRDDRARFGEPPVPEEPTQDVGQFLAHAPVPNENLEATALMRHATVATPEVHHQAPRESRQVSAPVASNPDNPWATEVRQKRAVVPEHVTPPVTTAPTDRPWGDTEVVSRSSFGALSSGAPPRDDQLSPVSGTLVGAPALAPDEQVTTIERREPPRAMPGVPPPVPSPRASRATIAGAVVAFIAGVALVIALVKVLGILPTAR